jgi:hypothetical protein
VPSRRRHRVRVRSIERQCRISVVDAGRNLKNYCVRVVSGFLKNFTANPKIPSYTERDIHLFTRVSRGDHAKVARRKRVTINLEITMYCSGFYSAEETNKHSDYLIICEYCVNSLTCSVCKKFANSIDQIDGYTECYCCGISHCYECYKETNIFKKCFKCKCWFCDKCDSEKNRRCDWNCSGKLYKFCNGDRQNLQYEF